MRKAEAGQAWDDWIVILEDAFEGGASFAFKLINDSAGPKGTITRSDVSPSAPLPERIKFYTAK